MKLSRRIRDLVQAGLTSPRRFSGLGKARSPRRMEAQLEHIRKSLAQAAAREKGLQDKLALAEGEGRERDALRLRRELRELERSSDQLRAALDMIEARVEMAGERQAAEAAASPQTSLADEGEEADLASRKARLAAPERGERREPEAKKPRESERD